MSVITPATSAAPAPCLVAAPWGGRVVSVLFLASLALFAFGVLAMGLLA